MTSQFLDKLYQRAALFCKRQTVSNCIFVINVETFSKICFPIVSAGKYKQLQVFGYCLMPNDQLFSYIMTMTSYIR